MAMTAAERQRRYRDRRRGGPPVGRWPSGYAARVEEVRRAADTLLALRCEGASTAAGSTQPAEDDPMHPEAAE